MTDTSFTPSHLHYNFIAQVFSLANHHYLMTVGQIERMSSM
jgi:hypothetical protein